MATQVTSSDSNTLHPGWSSLSGIVLEGGFELQEILEADESQARFKVRVLGDRDLDCVALFFQLPTEQAAAQHELWTLTRQLRHPNLSIPLGTGQVAVDGVTTVYAIVRRADESLDAVLSERTLTVGEAGEALESVAKGLEILHLNGLVHGCLAPSRVLAVAEAIKLPAECVRTAGAMPSVRVFTPAYLAPESQTHGPDGENVTPAADLWCLGATVFEALTQKPWTEDSRGETGDLPEPFASIALRCLHTDPDGRATLGEVVALLRGELKPVPRVRAAVAGTSTVMIVPEADLSKPEADVSKPERSGSGTGLAAMVPEPSALVAKETPLAEVAAAVILPEEKAAARPSAPASIEREQSPVVAEPPLPRKADSVIANVTLEPAAREATPPRHSFDEALRNEPVLRRGRAEESREPGTSLWIWAGLALVVVLGLIWALRPKHTAVRPAPSSVARNTSGETATPPVAVAPPAGKSAANSGNAWETRTLQPDGSAPRTANTPAVSAPAVKKPLERLPAKAGSPAVASSAPATNDKAVSGAAGPTVWRVVVYTYSHREDAEKKAAGINAKHPNLHAEVFTTSGSGPFLVALGGRMSREDAAQLKRKAVGSGMPRDSYIQNYNR